jgi:alpha-ketoglutarate-dependent taurine dioxygenase
LTAQGLSPCQTLSLIGCSLYAFDLIQHEGEDMRDRPFLDRKAELARLLRDTKAGILLNLSFRQGSAKWSMLHAKVIPPAGGDTQYTDTRAAYDALTDAIKNRLDGLVAEHSAWHSTAKRGGYVPSEEERRSYPPARHKLVRRHPGSGRNALYMGSHASHIVGMPVEKGRSCSPS